MKIRSKLLIILLSVSIIPLAVIQTGIVDSLHLLSNEIGSEMKNEMVKKSSSELKRLVEDHARILSKQGRIIEFNLQQLSLELAKWIESGEKYQIPQILTANSMKKDEAKILSQKFLNIKKFGILGKNIFDFNSLNYDTEKKWSDNLIVPINSENKIIPLFKTIEIRNPELVLWIKVNLFTGESLSYPKKNHNFQINHMSGMHKNHMGMMTSDSIRHASNKIGFDKAPIAQWSLPYTDPITGRTVLTASLNIISSSNKYLGSVSIDVPLDILLHGYNHLKAFSDNISSLLTEIKTTENGNKTIKIIAEQTSSPTEKEAEMMHMWQPPTEESFQKTVAQKDIEKYLSALENNKSGILNMPYKGQESIWAFSKTAQRGVSLLLILPHKDVIAPAEMAKTFIKNTIKKQSSNLILILSVVTAVIFILAFSLSQKFTSNILILVRGVKRIASGDFSTRVNIHNNDEIGELAEDFNKMVPALREHIEIKSALEVAKEVQENLLPKDSPEFRSFDIYGNSKYCDAIGGDYFDYLVSGNDKNCMRFIIGDVSGHGVPAAILMGSIRGYLHARNLNSGNLGEVLTDINKLIAADTYKTGQFMTMLAVEMNPLSGKLSWIRAGHDPAIIYDTESEKFTELNGEGIALGLMDDSVFIENEDYYLKPGQILILGTDGIWEAINSEGVFFGKDRLKKVISTNQTSSANEIAESIFEAVKDFTGSDSQEDDLTIMIVKRLNN